MSDETSDKTIAALFDDFETAADAVRRLEREGPRPIDICIVSHNRDDRYSHYVERPSGEAGEGDDVAIGTALGAVLGGSAGLLAGLGLMLIPGIGPAIGAGTFLATLVGAGAGAALGALAGSLADAGIDPDKAEAYAEGVRRGSTLVVVRTSEDNVEAVVQLLDEAGAIDMDERVDAWRRESWTGAQEGARSS